MFSQLVPVIRMRYNFIGLKHNAIIPIELCIKHRFWFYKYTNTRMGNISRNDLQHGLPLMRRMLLTNWLLIHRTFPIHIESKMSNPAIPGFTSVIITLLHRTYRTIKHSLLFNHRENINIGCSIIHAIQ